MRGIYPHTASESEDEVMRNYLCIHFPHKISPMMQRYLAHPAIVDVLTQVIGAKRQMYAVDALYQSVGQTGAGVAPGRISSRRATAA